MEAGIEEMHFTDEGWCHKPRNAGGHMKPRKSKAMDSPPELPEETSPMDTLRLSMKA